MATEQNISFQSLNVQPKHAHEHVLYQAQGKAKAKIVCLHLRHSSHSHYVVIAYSKNAGFTEGLSVIRPAQQEEERGFWDKTFQVSNLSGWSSEDPTSPCIVTVLC